LRILLLLLVMVAVTLLLMRAWDQRVVPIRLTAGRVEGSRYRVAQTLQREAATLGLRIDLLETAGSEHALERVNRRALDVALVQGGLGLDELKNVRQVAALHVEPLHLLVRGELHPEIALDLAALRGKTVNLGEVGSGTHTLAVAVLNFAGLAPGGVAKNSYKPLTKSYSEIEEQIATGPLPDALFMVSTLPSTLVRRLVSERGYRLVPLPFAEAFALDSLFGAKERHGTDVERMRVYDALIPAYTYAIEPPVPPEPLHTLGTRLLVVAHKDVSAKSINKLLETIFTTPFAEVARPPLSSALLDLPPEVAWHAGTIAYNERNKPLIAGDVVDLAEKWVSIAGVTVGGLFFLVQVIRRRVRQIRDESFESYIHKVTEVERQASVLERAAELELKALLELQKKLGRIKSEALDRFAEGSLEGAELLSSFLTHVSDARDYLTRMILHERDNLEDQARAEGRSARSVWIDAIGGEEHAESAS
jgi:TRAP-type uncharacterized transport system substrate-binding protein